MKRKQQCQELGFAEHSTLNRGTAKFKSESHEKYISEIVTVTQGGKKEKTKITTL